MLKVNKPKATNHQWWSLLTKPHTHRSTTSQVKPKLTNHIHSSLSTIQPHRLPEHESICHYVAMNLIISPRYLTVQKVRPGHLTSVINVNHVTRSLTRIINQHPHESKPKHCARCINQPSWPNVSRSTSSSENRSDVTRHKCKDYRVH